MKSSFPRKRESRFALAVVLLAIAGQSAAGERTVVADKSEIGFSVKQMGVAVSGAFRRFSGSVNLDPAKIESASAQISVEIASISTGSEEGDETALDKPWLDAAGFPKATFKSSAVRALGGERYEARGALSIRGKPREITVPFTLKSAADGTTVAAGDFRIRRTDFGIGGGEWNEADLVADEVPVHFKLTLGAPR
jgi:polyisoprenoid-binding protein YceI